MFSTVEVLARKRPLTQSQFQALEEMEVEIVNQLEPMVISENLLESGLMTHNDLQQIAGATSREMRVRSCMSILRGKQGQSFETFLRVLKSSLLYVELEDKLRKTEDRSRKLLNQGK